jgi:nicotinate-nucleotide adenylyltransferase
MRVGLYFGTFNPIHVGHLIIANYMAEHGDLDQIWIVVSPQNPLKKKASLLEDYHRLALVERAVDENPRLKACDIEFKLPQPSYTATTLAYLKEKYPNYTFALIMGEDNLRTLHKWKNYESIVQNHAFYVYPRALTIQEELNIEETSNEFELLENIHLCKEVPVMKISASYIRESIRQGKDVRYLLTEPVLKYVDEMNFYK